MFERRTEHPYWLWESIMRTPEMLEACLEPPVQNQVDHVADHIAGLAPRRVFCIGTGSSSYASMAHACAFEQIAGISTSWHVTSELGAYPPVDLGPGCVVVVSSHSGRTIGDLQVVELARQRGAYTVGVTDIADSPLAQSVDDAIIGPGGPKAELPATRTYASAVFRVLQLAVGLAKRLSHEDSAARYESKLAQVPGLLRTVLDDFAARAPGFAQELSDRSLYFVVSAGPNMCTAYEAALALFQATDVGAQPYHVEEVLHGPIQALTSEMCLVAIAGPGPLQGRILRAAQAFRVIGARVLTIAPVGTNPIAEGDLFIAMPADIPELLTPLLYIAPLWQIGYHCSLGTGHDPDRLSMQKQEFKDAFALLMAGDPKFAKA